MDKKLHLGCGNRKIHGFVNIDIRGEVEPDVICDIFKISEKFENIDLIYTCHTLEHAHREQVPEILTDWYTALKPGGILRLSVPDLKAVCEYYVETENLDNLYGLIYGGQKNPFDFHYTGFDYNTLRRIVKQVGFREFRRYDWRKTEHSFVDDYGQSYLPHMDKLKGRCMSLNVECVK